MKRIIVFLGLFLIGGALVVSSQRAPLASAHLSANKVQSSSVTHPGRALGLIKNWKSQTPSPAAVTPTPTPLPSDTPKHPRPTVWPKPEPTPEHTYTPVPTVKPYPSTPPCGGCGGWRGSTQADIMCPMSVQQICE